MRLTWKIGIVLGLTLAISIPLLMIRAVIADRVSYRNQALSDVAQSYGGKQIFAGPVLIVPYTELDGGETGKLRVTRYWTFFPATLDVSGPLRPDTRKRGLHRINVYEWQGRALAHFAVKIPDDANPAAQRQIGQPWLSYGIADVRGLRAEPRLRIDGQAATLEQGFGSREGSGLHARLPAPAAGQSLTLDADLELLLGGTETLALSPLGGSNRFALASAWPHPSFSGRSPRHTLDANGFRADWEIASVASNAQQQFLNCRTAPASFRDDVVGVSLYDPVDVYTQSDRATKYGMLFVLLTFVGFFIFELTKRLRIHPIQYALVGLGLAIFFLLLVSLSEHIEFFQAYLAAGVACIGLLGFYLSAVLRSLARSLGFSAMLAMLYAALYGLLISEDNALALGAGLLFVALAAIMTVTRQLDWYQFAGGQGGTHAMPRDE